MVKYLFILINSIFIFLFNLYNGDPLVTVTGKIPERIAAGQENQIEITVNKGELSGFAKLQVQLPEGFYVKESDELGATYSFEEGMAKWVWASLPPEEEVIVRFTVVAEDVTGRKSITAKFSYVENNEKKVAEMEEAFIMIESGDPLAADLPQVDSLLSGIRKDSGIIASIPEVSHFDPSGPVTVQRSITDEGNDVKLITLLITKGSTKGFARYSDDLPDGVIVRGIETDGSSFSVADGKIKFVWVNVPEKEVLKASYTMSGETATTVYLNGEYSYLENNQSKKYKLDTETLNLGRQTIVKEESGRSEDDSTQHPETETEKADALAQTETPVTKKSVENMQESGKTSQGNSAKTVYRVQVGAFSKKKVTGKKLEQRFKLKEPVISDMQGGFSKFMVGKHSEYREARDHRERVITENKIRSAFVVAYNHGKRITVQEALMITNQKWLK